MTDYALAFALIVGFVYWVTRPAKKYNLSEWRAAMVKKGIGTK